jgi:hypothetical protein
MQFLPQGSTLEQCCKHRTYNLGTLEASELLVHAKRLRTASFGIGKFQMVTLMWGCEGGTFLGCFWKPNFVDTCHNWMLSSSGVAKWVFATSKANTFILTFAKFQGHLTTSRGQDQPKPALDHGPVLKTGENFYFGGVLTLYDLVPLPIT